jgi:TRAP-type uncharacterized transport system substrate-binding protein
MLKKNPLAKHLRSRIILCLCVLIIAWKLYDAYPPSSIVIAAGPKGGFYDTTSQEIRRLLAAKGIDVEIINYTQTSNILSDVNNPKTNISLGFLAQKVTAGSAPNVVSLGSIMMDPLFIFQRPGLDLQSPSEFKDLKIAVSPANTASRLVSDIVLSSYGILPESANLIQLSLFDMAKAIEQGSVDVAFFLQPATNAVVAGIGERGIATLVSTEHNQAISKRFGYLSALTLSRGSFSVVKNIPPSDKMLVGVPVTVVGKANLHPALVTAVALALKEIVAPPTLVSKPQEFPSMDLDHSFEDSARAGEIYKLGTANEPFLYRHFNFKIAGLLDSLTLVLSVLISLYVILLHLLEPLKIWLENKPHRALETIERMHELAQERSLTDRELERLAELEEYFDAHHNIHSRSVHFASEIKNMHCTRIGKAYQPNAT